MTLTRRRLLTMSAGALLASVLPAIGSETLLLFGRAFGTSWQVRLRGTGRLDGLADDLAEVLVRIDRSMSPFRPDSEITQFNRGETGLHKASPDFLTVTAEALRIASLSGGAFDPSVGPDVGRYGFGPIHGERGGSFAGFATDDVAITKSDARLTLDLCGIAKGYALDLMAERISAAGFDDFVAELGGEVLARGADAGGTPWRIGISNPLGGLKSVVDAKGLALATSGDAINAYVVGGRRYSHIIDPRTDEPLENAVASVSVFAEAAMTADAFATALMVMGPQQGVALADALGLPALFLVRVADGLKEIASRAYDSHRMS